ncbi:pilus_cpaB, Flp pilus assembly protein CpaB [Acidimicrobiia bacterium]
MVPLPNPVRQRRKAIDMHTTTPQDGTIPTTTETGGAIRTRLVPRVRPRPNGRSLAGALLVTLAAVGAFWVAGADSAPPTQSVLVARRPLSPGEQLTSSDLEIRKVTILDGFDTHTYSDPAQVIGGAMLAPLGKGELLQRSAVLTDASAKVGALEFSFPIDRERAMNGELRPGETIDLLATYGTGIDAVTTVLARNALVRQLDKQNDGTMGATGRVVLTIGLATADELLNAVHAAQVAGLTAVRSTGAGPSTIGRTSTSSPISADRTMTDLLGAQR